MTVCSIRRLSESVLGTTMASAALLLILFATQAQGDITIGIIGDQLGVEGKVGTPTFYNNLKTSYRALSNGVLALNKAGQMDVVLHVGDLVESAMDDPGIKANFDSAVSTLNSLDSKNNPKWYLTPGDHDVNPSIWKPDSEDRSREAYFKFLYSSVNPRITKGLYYSFDVNGYHFVALYSLEHLYTDPRWGIVFFAQISDAQLDWLKQDLAAADTRKGVIVLTHQPLWYNWSSWLRVHNVLIKYNTKAVIAGHFHYDQSDYDLDGIQYRTVGATGGSIKSADPAAGGWWHVTRLTITDSDVRKWQLIPVGDYTKSDFTDRYDMDRIQALAYVLDTASQMLSEQTLFWKDGKLVGKPCPSEPSPQLTINGLGNPLEGTLALDISLQNADKYQLSGQFSADVCEKTQSGKVCNMKAGANIAVSNISLTIPSCGHFTGDYLYCTGYKTFWTGVISTADTPQAGDIITIRLNISYPSKKNGLIKIWRDTAITVCKCPS